MEFIRLEKNGSIATVTVTKPKALNALSSAVLKELNSALDEIEKDQSVRCLIVTGEGEKAFVAGADIKEINSLDKNSAGEFAGFGQKVFMRIETLRVPVIAAVNGFALGGGLELAMACDFILASSNAKFGLPECTLGLMPGFGGCVRLARKIGPGRAKQLTYTGSMISVEQAAQYGLVNEVFEQSELMTEVTKVAETMAQRAPLALTAIKKTIEETYGLDAAAAMKVEQEEFGKLFDSADCKEGTTAFIEKRKPNFLGK